MKTDKKPTYTTRGDVCHGCDHAHRTIAAARQCIDRQQARIARGTARYQIPRDYWHEPRARSLAEVRVRTARGGVAVHHQPLYLMRVEAS